MERPEVTLHDPTAADRAAAILGDDQPRSLRRPLPAGTAALARLAAAYIADAARGRRGADEAVLTRPVGLRSTDPGAGLGLAAVADDLQPRGGGALDTLSFRPANELEDPGGTVVLGLDRVQPLLDLVARACPDRRTAP